MRTVRHKSAVLDRLSTQNSHLSLPLGAFVLVKIKFGLVRLQTLVGIVPPTVVSRPARVSYRALQATSAPANSSSLTSLFQLLPHPAGPKDNLPFTTLSTCQLRQIGVRPPSKSCLNRLAWFTNMSPRLKLLASRSRCVRLCDTVHTPVENYSPIRRRLSIAPFPGLSKTHPSRL